MPDIKNHINFKTRWLLLRTRLNLPVLLSKHDETKVISIIAAINGSASILVLGLIAWLTDLPLIFPALGPSSFILFSSPLSKAAAPRNVIIGHISCLIIGFSVWHLLSYASGHNISPQIRNAWFYTSAAVALGISCLVLVRLDCPHPPACASSLVVALGMVTNPVELAIMSGAIVWLAMQGVALNRLAGVKMPVWNIRRCK